MYKINAAPEVRIPAPLRSPISMLTRRSPCIHEWNCEPWWQYEHRLCKHCDKSTLRLGVRGGRNPHLRRCMHFVHLRYTKICGKCSKIKCIHGNYRCLEALHSFCTSTVSDLSFCLPSGAAFILCSCGSNLDMRQRNLSVWCCCFSAIYTWVCRFQTTPPQWDPNGNPMGPQWEPQWEPNGNR